ncbi:MAG: rRNA pseudouridine synthase [Clostridia bacterium]|nr:rRNA pseudouridine synthase [Clostridia bacterium]
MEKIRLQKFFTDCGVLSRRAAEEEIKAGKVRVNGVVAQLGDKVDPESDIVEYKGRQISARKSAEFVYILLNKPCGVVTSAKDEKGRVCVTDIVKCGTRVYPVGRLDLNSQGLILMTNDGELTNKLTHPRHEIPKIYEVDVVGKVTTEQLTTLNSSMTIDGYILLPVKTEFLSKNDKFTTLRMTLFEGRNRQIRKMCEQVGLRVAKLTRISIGSIALGNLESGKWRYLTKDEVKMLKK